MNLSHGIETIRTLLCNMRVFIHSWIPIHFKAGSFVDIVACIAARDTLGNCAPTSTSVQALKCLRGIESVKDRQIRIQLIEIRNIVA